MAMWIWYKYLSKARGNDKGIKAYYVQQMEIALSKEMIKESRCIMHKGWRLALSVTFLTL